MSQAACFSAIKAPKVCTMICATCLSNNRMLKSLQVLPQLLSFCNVIIGMTLTTQDNICWECKAQLLKMLKFREKAFKAQCMLKNLSKLIQEPRSGQKGGIVESLSTLSRTKLLYYEVGDSIPAHQQTTQFSVRPIEKKIDNSLPTIVTVELDAAENEILEEVRDSACVPLSLKSKSAPVLEQSSSIVIDSESSDREATDEENVEEIIKNNSYETEMMRIIKLHKIVRDSACVPLSLKSKSAPVLEQSSSSIVIDSESSDREDIDEENVEEATNNSSDEEEIINNIKSHQIVRDSACVPLSLKSKSAPDLEHSSSGDTDSESSDGEAIDMENVEEDTDNSSDEVEIINNIKSHQIYVESESVPRPLKLEGSGLEAQAKDVEGMSLNIVDEEHKAKSDDVGVVGIITNEFWEKSFRSLQLEMLKEQIASWRVILHRLPTDTLPPSTATAGGRKSIVRAEYKMGLFLTRGMKLVSM